MAPDPRDSGATPRGDLAGRRQQAVEALVEHFANDVLGVEEFERRVELAHRAADAEELRRLLADLPPTDLPVPAGPAPVPELPGGRPTASPGEIRQRDFVMAFWGGSGRRGTWMPARRTTALAIMGGVELDFREAMLGPGVTDVTVVAFWGGIEIVVAPGTHVECTGIAIMGGFDHVEDVATPRSPDAPVLRINGLALMGGVEIQVRYPGESAREARRRRRAARRLGRGR